MPPDPTPFDTAAWHAAFDAQIVSALDMASLGVFALVLVGGIACALLAANLVAQLRPR